MKIFFWWLREVWRWTLEIGSDARLHVSVLIWIMLPFAIVWGAIRWILGWKR